MKLTSAAFQNTGKIPGKYTCSGEDINPPLKVEDVPQNTKSLVLIIDDPDAPSQDPWVHWVVYDIPILSQINENSVPGIQGVNNFKKKSYGGPCPPSGTHRYFFKLYALDIKLNLSEGKSKTEIEEAMREHVITKSELIGLFAKEADS
jgi:Raf kinase inhibitor-like YbhB/YbcL family protein